MSTVLITGANRGIGLELVKHYAARGDIVLNALDLAGGERRTD